MRLSSTFYVIRLGLPSIGRHYKKICVFHVSWGRSVRLQDGKSGCSTQLCEIHSVIVHLLRFPPSLSAPAMSTPATSSVNVHSCKVHPCKFLRQCPLLQCPPLQLPPSVSTPALSTPAISAPPLGPIVLQCCVVGWVICPVKTRPRYDL